MSQLSPNESSVGMVDDTVVQQASDNASLPTGIQSTPENSSRNPFVDWIVVQRDDKSDRLPSPTTIKTKPNKSKIATIDATTVEPQDSSNNVQSPTTRNKRRNSSVSLHDAPLVPGVSFVGTTTPINIGSGAPSPTKKARREWNKRHQLDALRTKGNDKPTEPPFSDFVGGSPPFLLRYLPTE